ncbi:ABC transporter ATP-binding protein [Shewanella dokdonensis]|uniref:ABC transporter ATP-binding protein n=1 Tax=Shewanella dokdonensis TaxID=712036 RepID=A0ABX8DCX6_9GAMM|nr:ABC transporter ATP-binding protein [Shewanella dokdonensis]MCL1075407.1 ABC transporter ATP-binding protein [Shewanella dokdonensis]QVK22101.1 ABC transporter ATP-binding protein [Shewanella dokdonensis]
MMQTINACELAICLGGQPRLQQVSLQLHSGELLALLGHNGAGKSTLIKLLLGLYQPDSGSLTVLGDKPGRQPLQVGYLPENVSFYPQMQLGELLQYFADLKGINRRRVKQLLAEFGLQHCAKQPLRVCSKGERQRLGLAQALLSQPALLLLDEPTVGLDPLASTFMYQTLQTLRSQGCSIVVCTHELALVEPVLDQLLILEHGRVAASGTLPALQQQAQLPWQIRLPSGHAWHTDPLLAPWLREQQLLFPASLLPQLSQRLTQHWHCVDYQLQPPDLRQLFCHFLAGTDARATLAEAV